MQGHRNLPFGMPGHYNQLYREVAFIATILALLLTPNQLTWTVCALHVKTRIAIVGLRTGHE